jgi:hypothetical protein
MPLDSNHGKGASRKGLGGARGDRAMLSVLVGFNRRRWYDGTILHRVEAAVVVPLTLTQLTLPLYTAVHLIQLSLVLLSLSTTSHLHLHSLAPTLRPNAQTLPSTRTLLHPRGSVPTAFGTNRDGVCSSFLQHLLDLV